MFLEGKNLLEAVLTVGLLQQVLGETVDVLDVVLRGYCLSVF